MGVVVKVAVAVVELDDVGVKVVERECVGVADGV